MDVVELLDDGAGALVRARHACGSAATLVESSLGLVRYAQALRRREIRWIRGAADLPTDDAEAPICARLRRLIDEGVLPRAELKQVWARVSPGAGSCTGCGDAFTAGEPEYEFRSARAVILLLHRHCFVLYARMLQDGGDGPVRAPA
jgi:hypothetical protein